MPIYEYRCRKCGHTLEKIQKVGDPLLTECPACRGPLEKLISTVAVQFKGGGPADTAVIAGEVGVTFGNISQEIGYVKAGRMRALASIRALPG